tara:strand:- start:13972 stop:14760 length:789 start_codon:yes stop_codon:yes gene_type:complete
MPRKSKKQDDNTIEIKNKKNLMNTIVKDISLIENEDIILQLPITDIDNDNVTTDKIELPKPYEPNCCYLNESNSYNNIQSNDLQNTDNNNEYLLYCNYSKTILNNVNNCYWCCHPIENRTYGMPYKYNVKSDSYVLFGNFCSLECANAYNFSSHCGSDKVWEINSYIQMLSKHFGCTKPIRPAPSRFLLKIFNGPLSIEEYRKSHITNDKTHIMNLPPMITTTYNYEIVNTSYIKNITDNIDNQGKENQRNCNDIKNKLKIN